MNDDPNSELREILLKAKQIIDSQKTWEEKYNLILGKKISGAFKNIVPWFDYYDPDGSYKDDVLA